MSHKPDSKAEAPAIAVALEYAPGKMDAPRVVASGKGFLAEQILEIAFANGVKVREDADLAQILSAVDVDTEIPVEAFAAVAEILAYIYHVNGNTPSEVLAPMGFGYSQAAPQGPIGGDAPS